jgi:hypothetical protein
MYTIIGADGKEYGPVAIDKIRRWIADGRANLDTRAKAAGTEEWKPLEDFPDFGGPLAEFRPAAEGSPASPGRGPWPRGPVPAPTDFSPLDCFSRSWNLLTRNFWPLVGVTVVLFLIDMALDLATGPKIFGITDLSAMLEAYEKYTNSKQAWLNEAVNLLVFIPLLAGYQLYFQRKIRHLPTTLRDLFAGFSGVYFSLIIAGLILGLLTAVGVLCFVIPAIYVAVAYYPFTFLLVADRRVGFWTALETSRRTITRHWWSLFLMFIIGALLLIAGFLAFGLGILVTFPLVAGAFGYAYEDLCGGPTKAEPEPVSSALPTA